MLLIDAATDLNEHFIRTKSTLLIMALLLWVIAQALLLWGDLFSSPWSMFSYVTYKSQSKPGRDVLAWCFQTQILLRSQAGLQMRYIFQSILGSVLWCSRRQRKLKKVILTGYAARLMQVFCEIPQCKEINSLHPCLALCTCLATPAVPEAVPLGTAAINTISPHSVHPLKRMAVDMIP